MGMFRGVLTLILLLAFVGLVIWAWSARRKQDFEQAARLPLDDEPRQHRDTEEQR